LNVGSLVPVALAGLALAWLGLKQRSDRPASA
jgi:hypothetical protein